jgi:hypothetical protein
MVFANHAIGYITHKSQKFSRIDHFSNSLLYNRGGQLAALELLNVNIRPYGALQWLLIFWPASRNELVTPVVQHKNGYIFLLPQISLHMSNGIYDQTNRNPAYS